MEIRTLLLILCSCFFATATANNVAFSQSTWAPLASQVPITETFTSYPFEDAITVLNAKYPSFDVRFLHNPGVSVNQTVNGDFRGMPILRAVADMAYQGHERLEFASTNFGFVPDSSYFWNASGVFVAIVKVEATNGILDKLVVEIVSDRRECDPRDEVCICSAKILNSLGDVDAKEVVSKEYSTKKVWYVVPSREIATKDLKGVQLKGLSLASTLRLPFVARPKSRVEIDGHVAECKLTKEGQVVIGNNDHSQMVAENEWAYSAELSWDTKEADVEFCDLLKKNAESIEDALRTIFESKRNLIDIWYELAFAKDFECAQERVDALIPKKLYVTDRANCWTGFIALFDKKKMPSNDTIIWLHRRKLVEFDVVVDLTLEKYPEKGPNPYPRLRKQP